MLPGDPCYQELYGRFGDAPGLRAFVVVDVERVSTSCGDGVPLMSFERHRDQLVRWAERKGPEGLATYRAEKNVLSLDGLAGIPAP